MAGSRLTGAQAASQILQTGGAGEVNVEKVAGQLTDHYDPRKKVLRLSEGVHDSPSIAALGIAAHEAGHALQHRAGYAPLMLRNAIYPVANIGSTLAMPLFIIGFIFSRGPNIWMDLGILLFTEPWRSRSLPCRSSSTRPSGPWPCSKNGASSQVRSWSARARSSRPRP